MKAYPSYKDSGIEWIGEIPIHWEIKPLKYLLRDGQEGIKIGPFGSSLKLEFIRESGYKVYGQENIINNDFSIGHRFIDDNKFNELKVYKLISGDIVMTMMGTTGKSNVVPNEIVKGIMDSHLIRLRANKSTSSTFLSVLINDSYYLYSQIKQNSKGSIMEGLNSFIIKSLLIATPPREEQDSINEFLNLKTNQIDSLIEKKQKMIELLKEERTAIIDHAVTKGLNPDVKMKDSGIEWIGEIPEQWNTKRLKYVAIKVQTGSTPPSNQEEYYEEQIEWFTPSDFSDKLQLSNSKRKISQLAIKEGVAKLFPANSVMLVGIGATLGKVGYIEKPSSSNQQINAIYFDRLEKAKFYAYFFHVNQNHIVSLSNAATLAILNQSQTKDIPCIVPSGDEEIEEIIEFIEKEETVFVSTISKIEKEIELLQEYRTVLISEAVTGKIDVRDEVMA